MEIKGVLNFEFQCKNNSNVTNCAVILTLFAFFRIYSLPSFKLCRSRCKTCDPWNLRFYYFCIRVSPTWE